MVPGIGIGPVHMQPGAGFLWRSIAMDRNVLFMVPAVSWPQCLLYQSSGVPGTASWLTYVEGNGIVCEPCLMLLSLAFQLGYEKKSAEHTARFSSITTTSTCLSNGPKGGMNEFVYSANNEGSDGASTNTTG